MNANVFPSTHGLFRWKWYLKVSSRPLCRFILPCFNMETFELHFIILKIVDRELASDSGTHATPSNDVTSQRRACHRKYYLRTQESSYICKLCPAFQSILYPDIVKHITKLGHKKD